jgi:hypothetical protein
MLKIGKVYLTESKVRFLIHARKSRPASNGFNYIGENLSSGLITYFNQVGKNVLNPNWQLKVDPYKWCGVFDNGEISADGFVTRDDLIEEFPGYLRMEDDNVTTILYMTRAGLEAVYA